MSKKKEFIWYILALHGINVPGYRLGHCSKCFSFVVIFLLILAQLHLTLANICLALNENVKSGLTYLALTSHSCIIFYSFFIKRKNIWSIELKLQRYIQLFNVTGTISNCRIKFMITSVLFIPFGLFIYTEICLFVFALDQDTSDYWFLGLGRAHSRVSHLVVRFYGFMIYYTVCDLPLLLTLVLNIILHRWAQVLKTYAKMMRLQFFGGGREEFLKEFFLVRKILRQFNQTVSVISFSLLAYALESIFSSLLCIVKLKSQFNAYSLTEIIFSLFIGIVILISYAFSCSEISGGQHKIKILAQELLVKHVDNNFLSKNCLHYLRIISKEDIVYMSACGMFDITRGLILSAIGVTLTYDLLIINFN